MTKRSYIKYVRWIRRMVDAGWRWRLRVEDGNAWRHIDQDVTLAEDEAEQAFLKNVVPNPALHGGVKRVPRERWGIDELVDVSIMGNQSPVYGYATMPYSTDIAAAWRVVERMFVTYKLSTAIYFAQPNQVGCYMVETRAGDYVGFAPEMFDGRLVMGRIVPLAICLAALRAVGTPEDEINRALEATQR